MTILYEDNHLIIVNKAAGEIVQGDKTGDTPLSETLKGYIKQKYAKPGNVFLGVVHRLDRPVSGIVVFARTSKALARLNAMFRDGKVRKSYHAIVSNRPEPASGTLDHWLTRNERLNKSFVCRNGSPEAKRAQLDYQLLSCSERYFLVGIRLHTGRHHQIRCQLAHIGCPIKGDLKYGAKRSNPDGSISLHACRIAFEHPVSHQPIDITAPYPAETLWKALEQNASEAGSSEVDAKYSHPII